MKKLLALVLVLGLTAGMCASEEIGAWNIDESVHPQLKQYLTEKAPRVINAESLPELRKLLTVLEESLPRNERVNVRNEFLPSGLRVRVYTPKAEKSEYPALLWCYGGGHIMGSPEGSEALLLKIADEICCIVVAPAYRQTPENPYPADINDCYSALVWMTENLPIRKDRVAVSGQSAGGGLTAAVALMARDKKGPAICFQMPLYPMLDHRNITPSTYQITDHRVWCRDFNLFAWEKYLVNVSNDVPAYASPALAEDLSNLPPAYILVNGLDPFRDEDIAYAQRLMQADVPVELHVVPGATHGFEGIFSDAEVSRRAVNEYVKALADALK